MLNRASIFVNFVNHFPLQIAPYFTALTVFTVTQGEAEMPPSPAHELCKLISQQQLDKAVDYFESLYLCFCGRVGNSVNEPIETLLLSTQMIPIMTSPHPSCILRLAVAVEHEAGRGSRT